MYVVFGVYPMGIFWGQFLTVVDLFIRHVCVRFLLEAGVRLKTSRMWIKNTRFPIMPTRLTMDWTVLFLRSRVFLPFPVPVREIRLSFTIKGFLLTLAAFPMEIGTLVVVVEIGMLVVVVVVVVVAVVSILLAFVGNLLVVNLLLPAKIAG